MKPKTQLRNSLVITIGVKLLDTFPQDLFMELVRKFKTEVLPDAAHRLIENES